MEMNRMDSPHRILVLLEMVAGLRFGRTTWELRQSLESEGFPVCERTVRRDLGLLLSLRLIETEKTQRGRVYYAGRVQFAMDRATMDRQKVALAQLRGVAIKS